MRTHFLAKCHNWKVKRRHCFSPFSSCVCKESAGKCILTWIWFYEPALEFSEFPQSSSSGVGVLGWYSSWVGRHSCRQGKPPSSRGSWAASQGLCFPSSIPCSLQQELFLAPAHVTVLWNYVSCCEAYWEAKIIITCHLFAMVEIIKGLGGVIEMWGLVLCKDWKRNWRM